MVLTVSWWLKLLVQANIGLHKVMMNLLTSWFSLHVITCQVGLLMYLRDAQELSILLLAALPRLMPCQSRFGVYLVGNACQWIFFPQAFTALNCGRSQT